MATETLPEWTQKHVATVKHIAARDGEAVGDVFERVRYMITNHGKNTFNTSEDLSGLVAAELEKK